MEVTIISVSKSIVRFATKTARLGSRFGPARQETCGGEPYRALSAKLKICNVGFQVEL
jgi:hypothetical protein